MRACAAELTGTYTVVFFGTGSVHVAVLTGGLVGHGQVAAVWGVALAPAICTIGAHMNPAMTLAFAGWE